MNLFPFLDHNAEKHRTENRRVVSRRRRRVWNCESPEWNLCFFFFSWTTSAYQDGLLGRKNKALRHSHGNALEAAERSFRFESSPKIPRFHRLLSTNPKEKRFLCWTFARFYKSAFVWHRYFRRASGTRSTSSEDWLWGLQTWLRTWVMWDNDWGEVHAVLMWWSHWECFCQNQVLVWNKLNDSEVKSETTFSLILMY